MFNVKQDNMASASIPGERIICQRSKKMVLIDGKNGVELKVYSGHHMVHS